MDISIIIPTFNRSLLLREALQSLRQQKFQGESEIIVVVDGCTDGTSDMLSSEFPEVKQVVFQTNVGATIGLNAGAKAASGELLLFLDDDMQYQPELVLAHQIMHQKGEYGVIIGHFPLGKLPSCSFFRNVIYEWTEDWQKHFVEEVSFFDALCSGHFSIRRELYENIGGFDENFSRWGRKDSELGFRLIESGVRFGFCRSAQAVQDYEKSPGRFFSDFEMLGQADVELYEKHPQVKGDLLLSGYHQAPWLVLLLRQFVRLNPHSAEAVKFVITSYLDQRHQNQEQGKFLEILTWLAADLFYWQGVRAKWSETRFTAEVGNPIAILMYHRIAADGNSFSVLLETFEKQMRYLQESGYNILPLADAVYAFQNKILLPPQSAVITFDDGYQDFLEAWKILKAFNFPATLFLSTAFLGKTSGWNTKCMPSGVPMLSYEEVYQLVREGVDIQAHSHKHTSFTHAERRELKAEIVENKRVLELLGVSAKFFAYPNGEYTDSARELLKQHGFNAALSCISTLASQDSDSMLLPRITVEEGSLQDFAMRLKYGVGQQWAAKESWNHLERFRPTKYWHTALDFDPSKIYVYQTKRPRRN